MRTGILGTEYFSANRMDYLSVAADQDHGQLSIFSLGERSIYNMIINRSFSLLNALP